MNHAPFTAPIKVARLLLLRCAATMTTNIKLNTRALTIFLLKDGTTDPLNMLPRLQRPRAIPITGGGNYVGDLYLYDPPSAEPKWTSFFDENKSDFVGLFNMSKGAVLLMQRSCRWFALCFGNAAHLIERDARVDDFGFRVTLNCVNKIRSIDTSMFNKLGSQARIQGSQLGELGDFGFEPEQDLLRAITGAPNDSSLGSSMSGRDSLKISVKAKLADLGGLLDRYLQEYHSTAYRQKYHWVDHIREETNKAKLDELNEKMMDRIRHRTFDKLWLAVPEIIDWDHVQGFTYLSQLVDEKRPLVSDLHISDYCNRVRGGVASLKLDRLKSHRIFRHEGDDSVRVAWSVYSCLYCEQELNGHTYLLTQGKWYCLDTNFVNEINKYVAGLVDSTILLPKYNNISETEYCEDVGKSNTFRYAHMDGDLISHGGGSSRIEFCDLYTDTRQMIHVKRHGASKVLSHLFHQGGVSSSLWLGDPAFRVKVNAKLPSSHQLANPAKRPNPEDYHIVFAVVDDQNEPIDRRLPFFSRLSLRNVAKQLCGAGYRVSLVRIEDVTGIGASQSSASRTPIRCSVSQVSTVP